MGGADVPARSDWSPWRRYEARPCKLKSLRHNRGSGNSVAQARGLQGRVSTRLILGVARTNEWEGQRPTPPISAAILRKLTHYQEVHVHAAARAGLS